MVAVVLVGYICSGSLVIPDLTIKSIMRLLTNNQIIWFAVFHLMGYREVFNYE